MVSLKDIAAELGISIGLVSKVLNGRMGTTRVSPHIRKKILKKAQLLGYAPNRNALALLAGKNGAIGIFINPWGEFGTEFIHSFLLGAADALKSSSYHMWLNFFSYDRDFYQQMDIHDMQQRVDGLIVGGHPHPELLPHLRKVEKAGIPVVTFFDAITTTPIVNLSVANQLQGYLPTEHLIALHCKKIAHFKTREARYNGYVAALQDHGFKLDPALVVTCSSFGIANGRAAIRQLLQACTPFDGIVAQSDHQAFGACLELLARGYSIPDQIRITGVDDSPICLASPVQLTSVTSECNQLGRLTIDTLLKKLAGESVKSILIPPRLVNRSST
jgi:LacI family transcriptional regulator